MDFSSILAGVGAGLTGYRQGQEQKRLRERAELEDGRRREREDRNLQLSQEREARAVESHDQNMAISRENLRRLSSGLQPVEKLLFNTFGSLAHSRDLSLDTRNSALRMMGGLTGTDFPELKAAPPSELDLRKIAASEARINQSSQRSNAGDNRVLTAQHRANTDQLNKMKAITGVLDRNDPQVIAIMRENELIRQRVYSNTGIDLDAPSDLPRQDQQPKQKKKLGIFQ